MKKIQNIYDNQDFFDKYNDMRKTKINANELIEIPIMKKLLGNLEGKTVLDLGCGDGEMSRYIKKSGAKSVLAIDISANMLEEAKRHTKDKSITYMQLALENIDQIKQKFDVVYSSLAFHYVKDFAKLMKDISNLLKKNGRLIFSQEHPIATAIILPEGGKRYAEIDGKRYFYVSDYNNEGKRLLDWNVKGVLKYHRNFSSVVNSIIEAGMQIEKVQESTASKKAIQLVEKYKYQKDRPYFLFVKAIKK